MTEQAFCSKCGAARQFGARFCPNCGLSFEAVAPVVETTSTGTKVLQWIWVLGALAGAVWAWANSGPTDSLFIKLTVVLVAWAIWVAVWSAIVAVVALFVGMLGFVAQPFKRGR